MGRDITHNLRAAMYSPADQRLNDFSKHQELLLPYTSAGSGGPIWILAAEQG
jgi:hypothetical protein